MLPAPRLPRPPPNLPWAVATLAMTRNSERAEGCASWRFLWNGDDRPGNEGSDVGGDNAGFSFTSLQFSNRRSASPVTRRVFEREQDMLPRLSVFAATVEQLRELKMRVRRIR